MQPSTQEVRGAAIDDLVKAHPAIPVHVWAIWNGVDAPMDAHIQAIAERLAGRVAFFAANVELGENRTLCRYLGIASVPTLVVWIAGALQRPIFELRTAEALGAEIEAPLARA